MKFYTEVKNIPMEGNVSHIGYLWLSLNFI